MKKIKSLIALLLVALMVLSATGCQKTLTPKETLNEIMKASLLADAYSADFEGKMGMTFDEATMPAEMGQVASMFENIEMSGTMQVAKSETIADMGMQYTVNLNGMAVTVELYFNGDQLIINYPMFPQYLVVDLEEVFDMMKEEGLEVEFTKEDLMALFDIIMAMLPEVSDAMMTAVSDDHLEMIESHNFMVKGQEVSSKALKMTFDVAMINDLMYALLDVAKENEDLYNFLVKFDTEGEIGSFEDYKAAIDEGIKELYASEDQVNFEGIFKKYDYTVFMGYDKDYRPTYTTLVADMVVYDASSDMEMGMVMDMSYTYNYETTQVDFPELNDTNSISIFEFMGGF